MDTSFAITFFGALFAIMNPVTNLPVFLSVTDGAPVAVQRKIAFGAVFARLVALLGLTFYFAPVLARHLSGTARVITSRLMGMILAAIAIGMITEGLKTLLPGLA